jgi:hypothetical protein
MAFNKLKDYDNEIEILNEGIERLKSDNINADTAFLETRKNRSIQMLYKQREEHHKKLEKEEKILQKVNIKPKIQKKQIGRAIIQFSKDMNLIKKYDSIANAVRESGVNSKSIRDAANGVQKHAGGYIWKYSDDEMNSDTK